MEAIGSPEGLRSTGLVGAKLLVRKQVANDRSAPSRRYCALVAGSARRFAVEAESLVAAVDEGPSTANDAAAGAANKFEEEHGRQVAN
jgi:hypothetical protein